MAFGDGEDDDDDDLPNKAPQINGPVHDKSQTTLASMESLTMPLVQEVVLSADIQCAECQKRVADVMSRMNETESVVVNVMEKKVTISCKYSKSDGKAPRRQLVPTVYGNPVKLNKIALLKRLFRSSLK